MIKNQLICLSKLSRGKCENNGSIIQVIYDKQVCVIIYKYFEKSITKCLYSFLCLGFIRTTLFRYIKYTTKF